MHLSSRQGKNRTYKNQDSKSIKKGKDTRSHRSLRLLLELERRLDSTSDRTLPALLLLNRNLTSGEQQNECGVSTFTMRGLFIGVNGTSTDLERPIWHQVEAEQPSHMAGRLGGAASTDSAFSSSCIPVATKAWDEPPQTLADRPAPGPTRPGV
jgi:hypothetical protein